jgi:putative transposase
MAETFQYGRRSIRLKGFDYSQPGAYFVTICTYKKQKILTRIENGQTILTPAGAAVRKVWLDPDWRFPSIAFLDYVIMTPSPSRGAASSAPTDGAITPGKIIRTFKSLSAMEANRAHARRRDPVWQRNYWDHIIRSAKELRAVRKYVHQNPLQWDTDPEYK